MLLLVACDVTLMICGQWRAFLSILVQKSDLLDIMCIACLKCVVLLPISTTCSKKKTKVKPPINIFTLAGVDWNGLADIHP